MNTHISWASGPLTIPYTYIMFKYITCDPNAQLCTNIVGVDGIEFGIFCIIIILHSILSLVHKVSVFDWSPYSTLPAAKAHSRVCIAATPTRAFITILFGILQTQRTLLVSYLLAAFCIVYQATLAAIWWYEQPFYKRRTNELFIWIYSTAAMASVSVMFSIATDGRGDAVCIGLFLVGLVLLVPSVLILVAWRVNFVRDAPLTSLKTATDVEIRIRLEIDKLILAQQAKDNGDVDDSFVLDTTDVDHIITTFSKQMKKSFKFNSVWATYVFLFKSNKFLAMQKIRHNLNNNPMLFDILPLQVRLRFFAEYSSTEEIEAGLVSFEEQQRLLR
jgi:hypothetical protein